MNRVFTIVAIAGLIGFAGTHGAYAQHRTGGNSNGGSVNGGRGSSNNGNANKSTFNKTNNGANSNGANSNGANSVVHLTNTNIANNTTVNKKAVATKVITTNATPVTTLNKTKITKLNSANSTKATANTIASKHIAKHEHWRHHHRHPNWYFAFYGPGTIYRGCWWPVYYPACFPPIYIGEHAGTVIAQAVGDAAIETEEETETESETAPETASETTLAETTIQVERTLKVVNNTKEEVEFFILMHTLDEGKWAWEPAAPGSPKETISFVLSPGEAFVVGEDNELFTANKIRIWAKSATKEWRQFEGSDLWLIDLDAAGQRRYQSPEMQIYTFRLPE